MISIAIIASLAVIHFFLKLIFLWFSPKFMNPKLFGQPEFKTTKTILYITFILYNIVYILHAFGVIKIIIK